MLLCETAIALRIGEHFSKGHATVGFVTNYYDAIVKAVRIGTRCNMAPEPWAKHRVRRCSSPMGMSGH